MNMFLRNPSRVSTAILVALQLFSAKGQSIRPPAVPLISCDPYFSIWSPADHLTGSDTVHWTGKPHRLTSMAQVDGTTFRLMGQDPANLQALPQTALEVLPTRTIYQFESQGVHLTLTFMTAALPEDIAILSRPVTYLTYDLRATDGKRHNIQLYFDASAELTVNTPKQAAQLGKLDSNLKLVEAKA